LLPKLLPNSAGHVETKLDREVSCFAFCLKDQGVTEREWTERNGVSRFKTGALNRSATVP